MAGFNRYAAKDGYHSQRYEDGYSETLALLRKPAPKETWLDMAVAAVRFSWDESDSYKKFSLDRRGNSSYAQGQVDALLDQDAALKLGKNYWDAEAELVYSIEERWDSISR